MGTQDILNVADSPVTLIIFTCTGREHLLYNSFNSFKAACDYPFSKTILAIDGKINPLAIDHVQPDLVVQATSRKGYVNNILQALANIDTPYFFWLEDDWTFHKKVDIPWLLSFLETNADWSEIVLSKVGPLPPEFKLVPLGNDLYEGYGGFGANPCLCNTAHVRHAFHLLKHGDKGDRLGFDGFENFLTRIFKEESITCVLLDPVDRPAISHEGYLESTPRNWHMTNSIEAKTKEHLLTVPAPSLIRRLFMVIKLFAAFFKLSVMQLFNNKIYELCFRVIASAKTVGRDD